MSVGALEGLPSERLMAYRTKLLSLEASAETSDLDDAELAAPSPGFLYF